MLHHSSQLLRTRSKSAFVYGDTAHEVSSILRSKTIVEQPKRKMKIVHPCTAFAFKKAFKNANIAMEFLNALLGFSEDEQIVEIEFLDTNLMSSESVGKDLHLLCKTIGKNRFLIEMQNSYSKGYEDKVFPEFCRMMSNLEIQRTHENANPSKRQKPNEVNGVWKFINKAYTIVITNKRFDMNFNKSNSADLLNQPRVVNKFQFQMTEGRRLGTIDSGIVIVALCNFTKDIDSLESSLDRWLFALKDPELESSTNTIPTQKVVDELRCGESCWS